ncbi:YncE family protein [Nocardia sp. alder85J]|uniref:YncE family protein n=1 Tax=Nocardia sp. alder85J TaxID=2862949 RepID=UPI001CD4086B|nr:YncE family protein [Nocardia sp. alder85J]MCX4098405.1 YncE family protein [Nocardia sp. alder85J]
MSFRTGVSILDTTTRSTVATVEVGGENPNVAIDPATHAAYVTSTHRGADNKDDHGLVAMIGPATHTVTGTLPLPGTGPSTVAFDPDLHFVFATSYRLWQRPGIENVNNPVRQGTVSVIDTVTGTLVGSIPIDDELEAVVVDPTTHFAYVTATDSSTVWAIDVTTRAFTPTPLTGGYSRQITIDSTTHIVYLTGGVDTVSLVDAATRTVTAVLEVGTDPKEVVVDPTTRIAYTPNFDDDTVSVIDPATRTVTATLPVGKGPESTTIDLNTHAVYVRDTRDDSVAVATPSGPSRRRRGCAGRCCCACRLGRWPGFGCRHGGA